MIRKILGTITTRAVTAALTLVIVLVNSYVLGAEKVGTISLILLAVTLIQLLNNFVGGGAIVYLVPRIKLVFLFLPSCMWALLTALAGTAILHILGLIPEGYSLHVLFLSVIWSLASVNFQFLLGLERISWFNVVSVIQIATLTLVLFGMLFIAGHREVMSYVLALYASYSVAFLLTFAALIPVMQKTSLKGTGKVIKEIFHYGSIMQTGNIIQFLNYRVAYYFLEFFMGRAVVGVYSVGVQLSESIWLSGRSIAMVQYTRISNEKDPAYAARLTLTLCKVSFLLAFFGLGLIFLLLWLFFPILFRPEFSDIWIVMASLAFGILVFSVSIVLSPYFSGLGKPKHNTISAAIGLVFTAVCGWILIPRMGIAGAGITASLSYSATALYQWILFLISTRFSAKDFLLRKSEVRMALEETGKFLGITRKTAGR